MNKEEKIAAELAEIQSLAHENKGVDLNALALNVLQTQNQNFVSAKAKRWAYLVSLAAPPFGLLFAAYYFFDRKSDAKTVAWVCLALTIFSAIAVWLAFKILLSGGPVSQIQQIKPEDLQQFLE